jgi:hypothetical protein
MSVLDPRFKYVHSTATDIRKTFARARRELAKRAHPDARSAVTLLRAPEQGSVRGTAGMFKTW